MKKWISVVLIFLIICLVNTIQAKAEEQTMEPIRMYTTAYFHGEITYSGAKVREGICAVKKEWVGLTAIIYTDDNGKPGELLGIYECLDTGFGGDADGDGVGSIEDGKAIDVYQPDYESVVEWMEKTGGKCWVQFIDAVG